MRHLLRVITLSVLGVMPVPALDADDFSEVVGYTVLTITNVAGDFEGADHDKLVKLDNGWVFEFTEYSYSYAYRPTVAVFVRNYSVEELQRLRPDRKFTRPLVVYKLLIDDEFYDVRRIR